MAMLIFLNKNSKKLSKYVVVKLLLNNNKNGQLQLSHNVPTIVVKKNKKRDRFRFQKSAFLEREV